jgi:hypothetical protein
MENQKSCGYEAFLRRTMHGKGWSMITQSNKDGLVRGICSVVSKRCCGSSEYFGILSYHSTLDGELMYAAFKGPFLSNEKVWGHEPLRYRLHRFSLCHVRFVRFLCQCEAARTAWSS